MKRTALLFGIAGTLVSAAVLIDHWPRGNDKLPAPPPETPSRAALSLGREVRLDATLGQQRVARATPTEVFLRLNLTAEARPGQTRPNVALAVVIDRSGSMAGEKMEQVRSAAKQLVDRLGEADQITLISYATDFSVDLPLTEVRRETRPRLHQLIDQIVDGGGTNLSGGLEAGLRELRPQHGGVRRLILLSDGNANQGIVDPRTLGQIAEQARHEGITISTLGVGVDFNEDLMAQIAQRAGGAYYYAREGSSVSSALDAEFRELAGLAARQVVVSLGLAPGVTVLDAFGYGSEVRGGGLIAIPVGDMAAEQKRQVVVRLQIPASAEAVAPVGTVTLSYGRPENGENQSFAGALALATTTDAAALAEGEVKDVSVTVEEVLAAQAREQAAQAFSSGQKQNALDQLRTQLRETKSKAALLSSPVLERQASEIEQTMNQLERYESSTDSGKDLIKREKARARKIFAY